MIRPNILLIVMDATRAASLSCYGYHRPTTPNLERFAERCVLYELAISPSGWSLPTHASLFTGLYPSKHGAHEQHKLLAPDHPTLAEILRAHGYRTVAICSNRYVGPATGLDRGFDEFAPGTGRSSSVLSQIARKASRALVWLRGWYDSGAGEVNKEVLASLRRLQRERPPFFLFVNFGEAHTPYRPPREYNRYLPDGVSFKRAREVDQDPWHYLTGLSSLGEQDLSILAALYDAEISYLDARIAEVVGWLEASGTLDETMVIITADHGENLGDHQMMGHKYCLYDTLVHVPLIIHYPEGVTTPGRVVHQVQTLDVLPTILSLLGDASSETVGALQGLDLLSSARHAFTVAEWARPELAPIRQRFPDADVSRFDRDLKMIRTDRHKYIWASDGRHELYDLQADPDEVQNLIAHSTDVAASLDRQLRQWCAGFEPAVPSHRAPEFDRATIERLRALGYLE